MKNNEEKGREERYRVMAIDYGTRRIGVAISDELRMLASARGTIENKGKVEQQILALAQKENVQHVLLGLPKALSGMDSDMTREVRTFGEKLETLLQSNGIGFEWRDERLTSVLANFNIFDSALPKSKREEKGRRDEEAARILLQEYLDVIKI